MRDYSLIYLNGHRREVRGREALMMMAEWLRKEAGMTGTKIVCAEGDCGACTVLRCFPQEDSGPLQFESMNSCIATVAQMDGSHVVTVEGIQNGAELSPVQQAMKECHGSQCGYCTPGFIMALTGMFEKHDQVDAKTANNYVTGNLCRCTGYQPILDAAVKARASKSHSVSGRYLDPAASADLIAHGKKSLRIEDDGVKFFAPVSLREAATFAFENPDARIMAASTDIGVQVNKGKPMPQAILSLHLIPELYSVKKTRTGLTVGARVTLSRLRREAEDVAPEFARFLNLFASPQIKNVATLTGNIANASPIGDTLPFLLIAGGTIHLASRPGGKGPVVKRTVPMTEFYLGYKKLAKQPGEIITHISFDRTGAREFLRLYKVSQRKDLDISAVSGAFSLALSGRGTARRVESARIAYGGVAATPVRVPAAEESLRGTILTPERIEEVAELIAESISPLSDVRGTAAYRRVLAANLFRRYGEEILHGP
ncbi:MAG: hypothetical protein RIQ81_1625 [Pseudomonadota bacterium]|jgi:xanthine dehydrogenase small subunit